MLNIKIRTKITYVTVLTFNLKFSALFIKKLKKLALKIHKKGIAKTKCIGNKEVPDKKINGILDQGRGSLILYEETQANVFFYLF